MAAILKTGEFLVVLHVFVNDTDMVSFFSEIPQKINVFVYLNLTSDREDKIFRLAP